MTPRVHVHLKAADLKASREFYRKFLGVEPVKDKPDHVKFLMPFFEKMAGYLLEVVTVHDLQDLVTNALAVASATNRGQHEPIVRPALGIAAVQFG